MTALAARLAAHRQALGACRPASWATPGGRWFAVGAVLLLLVSAGGLGVWTGKPLVAAVLAGVALVATAWGMLVHGLLAQNAVVAAVTVPRHVKVLRELAGAAWGLALLLVWAGAVVFGLDPVGAVLRHAVLFAALALVVRWPLLWVGVGFVPWLALVKLDPVLAQLHGMEATTRAAVVLAVIAVGPWWLSWLFGQGGALHRRSRAQQDVLRRILAGQMASGAALRSGHFVWLARVGRAMAWPFHRALQRASAPGGSGASSSARLMLALGPNVHPGVQAWWILVLGGLVGAAFLIWAQVPEGWQPDGHVLWGPTLGVMSISLNPVFGVLGVWRATRREQALLVLLPGIERGGRLNQALARRMALHFGLAWAGGALVLAGFAVWVPALAGSLAIAVAAQLPLAGFLFTDLSRLPDVPNPHLGRVMFCFAGLQLLALVLHQLAGVPAALLVAILLLGAGAWLAARYRALARTPQGLPCGRLA